LATPQNFDAPYATLLGYSRIAKSAQRVKAAKSTFSWQNFNNHGR